MEHHAHEPAGPATCGLDLNCPESLPECCCRPMRASRYARRNAVPFALASRSCWRQVVARASEKPPFTQHACGHCIAQRSDVASTSEPRCTPALRLYRGSGAARGCRSGGGKDGSRATNTGTGGGESWGTGTAATRRGDAPECFRLVGTFATACTGVASAPEGGGPSMGLFFRKQPTQNATRTQTCVEAPKSMTRQRIHVYVVYESTCAYYSRSSSGFSRFECWRERVQQQFEKWR